MPAKPKASRCPNTGLSRPECSCRDCVIAILEQHGLLSVAANLKVGRNGGEGDGR